MRKWYLVNFSSLLMSRVPREAHTEINTSGLKNGDSLNNTRIVLVRRLHHLVVISLRRNPQLPFSLPLHDIAKKDILGTNSILLFQAVFSASTSIRGFLLQLLSSCLLKLQWILFEKQTISIPTFPANQCLPSQHSFHFHSIPRHKI